MKAKHFINKRLLGEAIDRRIKAKKKELKALAEMMTVEHAKLKRCKTVEVEDDVLSTLNALYDNYADVQVVLLNFRKLRKLYRKGTE